MLKSKVEWWRGGILNMFSCSVHRDQCDFPDMESCRLVRIEADFVHFLSCKVAARMKMKRRVEGRQLCEGGFSMR